MGKLIIGSLMELFAKALRFTRNPRPYFAVIVYDFLALLPVIKAYRKFFLPKIVYRVRRKRKINIIFLAMNVDMWRYDGVYRRFFNDTRFNPVIVTAMREIPDMEERLREQDLMVERFDKCGFNVVCGYDSRLKRWIDINKLKPDIIFYTQPYNGGIERKFEYCNHLNSLLCYSPYSFQLSETKWAWDNNLQHYCWKQFCVGDVHIKACNRLSRIGSVNLVPAGYCFEEEYMECVKDVFASNKAWSNDTRKRVIWAPHHSVSNSEIFKASSFLEIADLMVRLREEYSNRIVFAFKPHPVLKTKLYKIWGRDRTDYYYEGWANAENSFDAQGDYHSLFAGSDAMIHCSGSFIVEYLYANKPVLYVYSKSRKLPDIGPIGDAALKAHYSAHSENDIRVFINEVVLGEKDAMRIDREKVTRECLKSPNGKMFSENVYMSILEELGLNG